MSTLQFTLPYFFDTLENENIVRSGMMSLNQWFDKGISPEEYMSNLDDHKDNFAHVYDEFVVPDSEAVEAIKGKNLRVLALAEVWCGHCMFCVPILLRLAERTGMPVSMLPRDENLELMDQYLTNDKRIIPIFIFIDEDGNEVATWGPMAETTRQYVDEMKKDLPAKEADDYEEKFKTMIKETSKVFTENSEIHTGTYESIVNTLS